MNIKDLNNWRRLTHLWCFTAKITALNSDAGQPLGHTKTLHYSTLLNHMVQHSEVGQPASNSENYTCRNRHIINLKTVAMTTHAYWLSETKGATCI